MRRYYNIVPRILLILTIITFALAAPALVQKGRQASVDMVHVPRDVLAVLGKRIREQDLDMLWDGWWHYYNVLSEHGPFMPPGRYGRRPMPVIYQADVSTTSSSYDSDSSYPETEHPESIAIDDDGPHSQPASPKSSTGFEDWYTALQSGPKSSTESEGWHTADSEDWYTGASSLGSSTESDSDSDRWSTISNAPSANSLAENLNAVNYELKGKAKVERRVSGTGSGLRWTRSRRVRSTTGPGP